MNISQLQHFAVLFIFALMWLFGCRFWTFFALAIIAVELDQAISYASPWYSWFVQLDTLLDIVFGVLGMAAARWLFRKILDWEKRRD